MDSLKHTLIVTRSIIITVIPNYLDEVDKLDDVDIEDDVDTELEVDKLNKTRIKNTISKKNSLL